MVSLPTSWAKLPPKASFVRACFREASRPDALEYTPPHFPFCPFFQGWRGGGVLVVRVVVALAVVVAQAGTAVAIAAAATAAAAAALAVAVAHPLVFGPTAAAARAAAAPTPKHGQQKNPYSRRLFLKTERLFPQHVVKTKGARPARAGPQRTSVADVVP